MSDTAFGTAVKQAVLIALLGAAIGLLYNHAGLQAETWGIAWKGEKRSIDDLPVIGDADGGGAEPAGGVPAGAGDAASGVDGTHGSADAGDFPIIESDDPMGMLGGPAEGAPAAVDAALPEIPELGRPVQIQLPAVKRFYDADGALIVDAREPHEFAEGRIRGSINLPYDRAVTDPAMLESLDTGGRPIIVYCGGGTCELSLNLGFSLVEAGHTRVCVFMGGYPEWVDAGYPIDTGAEG